MRKLLVLAAAGVALVAAAVPAWAHEEISPYNVPTGRPTYLTLSVANEKRVDLNKVTATAPSSGQFGHASRDPQGWTSTVTHNQITWTGGAVKPGRFEQFGFDVEGFGQPGTFTYMINLAYTDGTNENVDVPVVAVTDLSAPAAATPATTVAGATTTTLEDHHEEDALDAVAAANRAADDADSRANLAVGFGVVALVGAGVALVSSRRKPSTPAAAPSGGSGSGSGGGGPAGSGGGQDW